MAGRDALRSALESALRAGPMLATSGPLPSSRSRGNWAYEAKWDGVRALVSMSSLRGPGALAVHSRRGLEMTGSWPELGELAADLPDGSLLDGEIVAMREGVPSFEELQRRIHVTRPHRSLLDSVPISLMIFDLVMYDGYDLRALPLAERREVLEKLHFHGVTHVAPSFAGPGQQVLDACLAQGMEGVVAKRTDSIYTSGRRSADWVKVKPRKRQEFVIGGWEPGVGGRAGRIGSLAIGYYDGADLVFAGQVGSGLGDKTLGDLDRRFRPLGADRTAFDRALPPDAERRLRWLRPELVCEVEYGAWTDEGRLRFPIYKGLRIDKSPRDVVRES